MQNPIINPYNILFRIENIPIHSQIYENSRINSQRNGDTSGEIPARALEGDTLKCKNCNIQHTHWVDDIQESRKAFMKYANSDNIDQQHKLNIIEHINMIDEIIQEMLKYPPNLHKMYIDNQVYDSFSILICTNCYIKMVS